MKFPTMFLVAAAAFAGACDNKATVQGEAGRKLTLSEPKELTILRGGTAKSDVRLKRTGLDGAVTIKFDKLPKGVSVVDAGNKILGDDGTYTFQAAADADLVENYAAQVTAIGPDNAGVTQTFVITVREQKQ
jgi:hypothetical protein